MFGQNMAANQDADLNVYAMKLYERRNEGVILKCAEATIGEWKPQPNRCHENVSTWCEHDNSYQAVRGWFYLDQLGEFIAHSVVRIPSGELRDITPISASQQYPFIIAEESEAEYEDLIIRRNISRVVLPHPPSPIAILFRQFIP